MLIQRDISLVNDTHKSTPFIIISREWIFYLPAGNQVISGCSRKDAGTRLVLHDSKIDCNVAVACKDTIVCTLMIWTYSKLSIINNWCLKYDHKKIADIRKICSYLSKTLSVKLYWKKIQALAGCNTTSYLSWVGKIKVFKKLLGQQDLCFL